jgi:thiosulfate/3-mercaptopyruvate sulfurtransferase
MTYVVVGAGAIGATLAARLHEAGVEVVLVARGAHLEALRSGGLVFRGFDGERVLRLPVAGGPDDVALQPGDVLVVATKSQDAEQVLVQWATRPVGAPTRRLLRRSEPPTAAEAVPVVLLQNGLDTGRAALRRFAHVVDSVAVISAQHVEPGVVEAPWGPSPGAFLFGTLDGSESAVADRVVADLDRAGVLAKTVPDILAWKAGKLVANASYNIDAVFAKSTLRDRLGAALRAETTEVMRAAGIEPKDYWDSGLDVRDAREQALAGRFSSSTFQSLQRGAAIETDFLNGEVVLQARLLGLRAPCNEGVQRIMDRAARAGVAPGALGADAIRPLLPRRGLLVSVAELQAELAGPKPPVLLDVRWVVGDPLGRAHYEAGHLPGAVFVDLDAELAAPPGAGGRHPLPQIADLQAAARRWGVRSDRPVVVYDDNGGLSAARAWWLLRWGGFDDVRLLDGALGAWRAAHLPLATEPPAPAAGDVELSPGHLPVIDADEAAAFDGVLLDARVGERFRGEVEPIDPVAGHIPGAVSASTADNLDPTTGGFRSSHELRGRFDRLAPHGPVAVYCGSGVQAAHEVLALGLVGVDAALYPGSWSGWLAEGRPVATGA